MARGTWAGQPHHRSPPGWVRLARPSHRHVLSSATQGQKDSSFLDSEEKGPSHQEPDRVSLFSWWLEIPPAQQTHREQDLALLHGKELRPLFIEGEDQRSRLFLRMNPTGLVCAGTNLTL